MKLKNALPVFKNILKWTYRILNYFVRFVLLLGLLYAIFFSVSGTYAIYKAASYSYDIYKKVEYLKFNEYENSMYMQALRDSVPGIQIKHRFIPLDSISPYLRRAVIASEDAGFYFHPGFDIRAIAEALAANQNAGKTKFGGSTITQQLAKNLFLSGERSFDRKFKELAYALLMEKMLGKDRILELYLNYAQWGKDIFGCAEACKTYFKKDCKKLTLDQAISMAATLASPGKHNPHMKNSVFMAKRRTVIYQNMFPQKDSLLVDSLKTFLEPKDSTKVAE